MQGYSDIYDELSWSFTEFMDNSRISLLEALNSCCAEKIWDISEVPQIMALERA